MARAWRWRWRPGGAFVLGGALGLLAGRPFAAKETTQLPVTPQTTLEDQLLDVGSPVSPPRARRPLRPIAARALHDVVSDLRALVQPADGELVGADEDYARYYHSELAPRLLGEDLGLDDRDVFDLGPEEGERLVLVGTWRDTVYCHDLWFVAGLERSPVGRYQVVMFRKLRASVDGMGAVDLDRDGRSEVVLRTLFGVPGNGPAWHTHVVSRGRDGWTCSDLASRDRALLVDERGRWCFATPNRGQSWGWRSEGFETLEPRSME